MVRFLPDFRAKFGTRFNLHTEIVGYSTEAISKP